MIRGPGAPCGTLNGLTFGREWKARAEASTRDYRPEEEQCRYSEQRHWHARSASRVAILWATVGVAAAQGTTGSIAGFVTDESKAALPGATVTVKEVETGQSRVLATDAAGALPRRRARRPASTP